MHVYCDVCIYKQVKYMYIYYILTDLLMTWGLRSSTVLWPVGWSLSLAVRDQMPRSRLLDGSRQNSVWQGWLRSLMIPLAFVVHPQGVEVLHGWQLHPSDELICFHHQDGPIEVAEYLQINRKNSILFYFHFYSDCETVFTRCWYMEWLLRNASIIQK